MGMMNLAPIKYKIVILLLVSVLSFSGIFAQQTRRDSIADIQTFRTEAKSSIAVQNFNDAIVALNKAHNLSSDLRDPILSTEVQLDFAELHFILQNYDKATSETEKAIAAIKELKDPKKLGEAYTLYGLLLTQTEDLEGAEKHLKDADRIFTDLNDDRNRANVIQGLGILELKRQNYKTAVNYFDAAIPLFQTYELTRQEALTLLNKAEAILHLDQSQTPNSLGQAKRALDDATRIIDLNGYDRLKIDSYRIASHIALRSNNFGEAQTLIETYEKKRDSLYQVYVEAISTGVEAEASIVDLNNIIEEQKEDIDKKQKSINFGKMTTGLSIALIVILSLLTLSLYKNNNLRAKANELLQDKNNELQLAKEKAEKASLAKAQFLSTITHELRTPLYAVTGLTHLLLEENPKPDQKEHLNSLKFSGEYLLSLINNILDLNKLEANKVEVEKTTFVLKKRINDVLIALRKSAEDRKNNLHFEFDETIPDKLVGDPLKLSQILINLVGNSVKFTQNGDVYVRVRNIDQSHNKVKLHFEIEDNGVGISKKKQKSIFETFSQASLQINRKFGGTGLGLSIVKNLLELMGSRIHLESQLGKGSKFWFDITFDISEEFVEDKNPRNIIYDVDYVALENRNILIVEDNKINQMITKKILEKNKMKCMVADNGMDAIKLVKEHTFDVILMDIHMPGISGIQATQKIREFDKQIPIIALTAVTIDENLDDFYRAGFNEIIPKPFKTEEFFEKIYRTLENRKLPVSN